MPEERTVWKLNPELVFREDDEGGLLFDPTTGQVRVLNETGAFICRHLDGNHTLRDIAEALGAEFEIPPGTSGERETHEFLDRLRAFRAAGPVV